MESFERARLDAYFRRITDRFPAYEQVSSLLVTHLLADRPSLVRAVARLTELRAVLPKPKSIHAGTLAEVKRAHLVDELVREHLADPDNAVAYLERRAGGQPVILLDIGGYFAPALNAIAERFNGELLGVVEDTENGHKRYLDLAKPPCPVYSIARSPLKEPEDQLVGQSVAFSTEALIRGRGDIIQGRRACVIGFGKVGSSVARTLHAKGVSVRVFDTDPVRAVQAGAQGFHVADTRENALDGAGLVVCATGNMALRSDDFRCLRNGAYVATVTSSEDELELDGLEDVYRCDPAGEHVTMYSTAGQFFFLLNGGEAVNFLHGASVGSYIALVQGEILAATARLTLRADEPAHHELPDCERRTIAETWLRAFNEGTNR